MRGMAFKKASKRLCCVQMAGQAALDQGMTRGCAGPLMAGVGDGDQGQGAAIGANGVVARHHAAFLRRRGFASVGALKSIQCRLNCRPVDLGDTLAADTAGERNVAILKVSPLQA